MILIGIFDLLIYPLIDSKCLSVVMMVNFAIANYQRRRKKILLLPTEQMDFCLEKRHAAIGCRSKEWDTASDHNFAFNPFVWLGGLNGLIDHHGFF